jgi:hypothetical protein
MGDKTREHTQLTTLNYARFKCGTVHGFCKPHLQVSVLVITPFWTSKAFADQVMLYVFMNKAVTRTVWSFVYHMCHYSVTIFNINVAITELLFFSSSLLPHLGACSRFWSIGLSFLSFLIRDSRYDLSKSNGSLGID